jgi:hypothetical protein
VPLVRNNLNGEPHVWRHFLNQQPDNEQLLTPKQQRISELTSQLGYSSQETEEALTRPDSFKRAVRATVIENIKNGTMCRPGDSQRCSRRLGPRPILAALQRPRPARCHGDSGCR